jgi:hypothetical protein
LELLDICNCDYSITRPGFQNILSSIVNLVFAVLGILIGFSKVSGKGDMQIASEERGMPALYILL